MRVWHDWSSEEKAVVENFHRSFDQSKCPLKDLADIIGWLGVSIYTRPLLVTEIRRCRQIMGMPLEGELS